MNFDETFEPRFIMMAYASESDWYLETHRILKDGRLGVGQPLKPGTIAKIADNFTSKKMKKKKEDAMILKGYVPPNVIYLDQNFGNLNMAWMVPEKQWNFKFDKDLKLKDGKAYAPNMIFAVRSNVLYTVAVKDDGINLDMFVWEPPFMNISNSGSVCMGTAVRKQTNTYENFMMSWEIAFFESRFTHEGTSKRMATISILELWKEAVQTKRPFNYDYLVRHGEYANLRDFIEKCYKIS